MKNIRSNIDELLKGNRDFLQSISNKRAVRDIKIDEILKKREVKDIQNIMDR